MIDDVTLQYNGNQMTSAVDIAGELTYSGANDFDSGTSQYSWDANGNMVSDTGKGIESVTYNRFNLPTRVDMSNGNYIKYVYDGRGRKLSATVYALPTHIVHGTLSSEVQVQSALVPVAPTTRYHDNYMYELTRTRILIPGGYILRSGSTYTYHYYVTDYQGNVRAVIDEDGNLEEANDYYPYGMLMTAVDGTFPAVQPYKYAAKEYETAHGLNLYDFGARHLNSTALTFTTPDPLCEKYYSISPYTYCAGNPVMLVDPTGMVIEDPEGIIKEYIEFLKKTQIDLNAFDDIRVNAFLDVINKSLSEINELEGSKQVYRAINTHEDTGSVYYDTRNNKFMMTISSTGAKFESVSHELKHAYQFEKGQLSFGLDGKSAGFLTDITDEINAYNRSYAIYYGAGYYDSNGNPLENLYANEEKVRNLGFSNGKNYYSEYPSIIINKSMIENILYVHGIPLNIFIGWKK